jgi:hypothetical protein
MAGVALHSLALETKQSFPYLKGLFQGNGRKAGKKQNHSPPDH